jgi:hypothetical protein
MLTVEETAILSRDLMLESDVFLIGAIIWLSLATSKTK